MHPVETVKFVLLHFHHYLVPSSGLLWLCPSVHLIMELWATGEYTNVQNGTQLFSNTKQRKWKKVRLNKILVQINSLKGFRYFRVFFC